MNQTRTCAQLHQPGKGQWDFQQPRKNTATQQRQTCERSVQSSAGIQEILPQMQQLSAAEHLCSINMQYYTK